jgi:6,7-dimethyl-8-ribityllumazine synthase
MASSLKNLSEHDINKIPSAKKMRFGIVVSEWNTEITEALYEGCFQSLIENGADKKNIFKKYVPGSFELTLGAQVLAADKNIDAVICLGCVIQGETRHFDFICDAVANGITNVSLKYNKPVIFGVLTPNNQKQAWERSGGKHGNKGVEAAVTAIKMVALMQTIKA